MAILGINVEVGTVMTATVAMGIAVDDTVHYVTWFRRGYAQGLSQGQAVRFAYRLCGTAMVQTSLIVGLGLLVYALSDFGPIQRFAWLMFTILMLALVSDLTVTPALLYSRSGDCSCRDRSASSGPRRSSPASQPGIRANRIVGTSRFFRQHLRD